MNHDNLGHVDGTIKTGVYSKSTCLGDDMKYKIQMMEGAGIEWMGLVHPEGQ